MARPRETTWDEVYVASSEAQRSWSEADPTTSLHYVGSSHLANDAPIIDVGGGASRLVDELVARHFSDVTVLDVSGAALAEAKGRVSDKSVHWVQADLTTWRPPRTYALWHDRAVFHFLVEPGAQANYVATATEAVRPNGHLVIATYSHAGPDACSGQPVTRWSVDELADLFAEGFTLVEGEEADSTTPWGEVRPLSWAFLRREAS